jgi:hypothetical protein
MELVAQIEKLRTLSENLWDAACEDDRDFREQADVCDDRYADAIAAIENANWKAARKALEAAKSLEDEGGDSQHAQSALKALDEHLETLWWAWHDADSDRWSPGEDADAATVDANRRCAMWVKGYNSDGPEA